MPQRYKVTDPNTGRRLTIVGDAPPTEQELEQLFAEAGEPAGARSHGEPSGMGHEPDSYAGGFLKGIFGNPALLSAIGGGAGMALLPEGAPLWLSMLAGAAGAGAGSGVAHGVNAGTGYEPADAAADSPLEDAAIGGGAAALGPALKAGGGALRVAGEGLESKLPAMLRPFARNVPLATAAVRAFAGHPYEALGELAMDPRVAGGIEKVGEGLTRGNAVRSMFRALGIGGGEEAAPAAERPFWDPSGPSRRATGEAAQDAAAARASGVTNLNDFDAPTDSPLEPSSTFYPSDKTYTMNTPRPQQPIGGDVESVSSGRSGPLHNYNMPKAPAAGANDPFEPSATRAPSARSRASQLIRSTFGDIELPSEAPPFEPSATRLPSPRLKSTFGDIELPADEPPMPRNPPRKTNAEWRDFVEQDLGPNQDASELAAEEQAQIAKGRSGDVVPSDFEVLRGGAAPRPRINVDESSFPAEWRKGIPGIGETSETGGVSGRGHLLSNERTIDLAQQLMDDTVPGARITRLNKLPMPSGDAPVNRALRQRGHIAASAAKKLGTTLPAWLLGLLSAGDEEPDQ